VHLNIVGMRKCMDDILQHVLQPLAMAIYMNDHRDVHSRAAGMHALIYNWNNLMFSTGIFPDHFSPLQSHHSFTIRYSLGEDTGAILRPSTKPKPSDTFRRSLHSPR
jgi:hypothetical protein